MKIILTGYMGSGKTSIGKMLSKKINLPFYDLDAVIENIEQQTIGIIFKQKGEVYFRRIEHQILNHFIKNTSSFILSLGGGTPCYANNHLLLQEKDIQSFYLKASVNTLEKRLWENRISRPLLASIKSREELNDYVRKHLFDRNFYYTKAKQTINIDTKTSNEIVNEIVKTIK